ncbi:MAG: hypothetical protein IKY04_07570 [Lachnospiraceae bacterium]|nr:hypothetical protein [Lachnospiraceae bacterium]
MQITVTFDVITKNQRVVVEEGWDVDIEVTAEEYQRITDSYESNKFAGMYEDESLKDICDRCSAVVNEWDVSDDEAYDKKMADYAYLIIYRFDYPVEVRIDHAEHVWHAGYDEIAHGELIPTDAKLTDNGDGTYTVS